jgi:tetratricopeptide (TPR) repeat protein
VNSAFDSSLSATGNAPRKDGLRSRHPSPIFKVAIMKRQRFVSQRSLTRLLQEAAEAWKRQDYQATIETLERAARLDPANSQILLDLGRAYGLRYDYGAAERCLEKAVRVAPKRLEALAEAGNRCHEFGSYPMAKRYFERAAEQNGAPAGVFVRLAELSERHARLEEAAHWVERALALHADHPAVWLTRARLSRLGGKLEEAEAVLRSVLAKSSTDVPTRVRLWYELGGVLDRQGRYDDAMAAFLEAKALQRPASPPYHATLQGVQARVREMGETISASVLERWFNSREALEPSRRVAVLCGHPRSGTTLLEQVLDCHPDIVTAEETHILHDEAYLPLSRGFAPEASLLGVLESTPVSALRQSREDYFRFTELFIGKTIGNKLLIDKNPALNVLIPAVVRIFPEVRFLIAIRDPRDVCLSCFMQPLSLNPVSSAYLTLEGTVTQYASVMGFWRTILPRLRNAWIEIRYEEVVADLEAASRQALTFLGAPWNEEVLRFHQHARSKSLRSPSYAEVTQPIFKGAIGRWRNYQKYLEPWVETLDPFIHAYGYE